MKTWGVGLWAIFLSLIALIIGILFVISRNYIDLGIMQYYLIWATLLVTGIILNTRRQAKVGKHLHIHHYTIA